MAQSLLLGLGGTGSRIVNNVAMELKKKKIGINDGNVCCVVLDTNENDRKKIKRKNSSIPVVGTSKERTIKEYIDRYANKGVNDWMPVSAALLKESMLDGASQMRPKSRLAFMDTIADKSILEVEEYINRLFDKRDDGKIRVMIVSSLAGGTGSGMFIQTALWLRKFFEKRKTQVTIRGIFVLPDVFINTIEDIRNDETEAASLYANAYGAIRELNAITKIKTKGYIPPMPIKIDDLFDSEKNINDGQPVFDYSFFIDDISEGGSVLSQIAEYEQVVARLVYMQLYAPMNNDLYSEEDNLFKRFQNSKEPVFGSCGTAKAIYPVNDILNYCSLRAVKEAISDGWRRLDDEINDRIKKEEEAVNSGKVLSKRIIPRYEYVRLFDNKSKQTGEMVGRDKLFINIATDVLNEHRFPGEDGYAVIEHSNKIDDFLKKIDSQVAITIDTDNPGNLTGIKLAKSWVEKSTETKESLLELVEKRKRAVERFLNEIDRTADEMADGILDSVFPADMGDINAENDASVFGLLTQKDSNNEVKFVHPVAVRYLVYKLAEGIEKVKNSTFLANSRKYAADGFGGGKKRVVFDNPKTKVVETDANEYLNSKKGMQKKETFIKTFMHKYAEHNVGQFELCRAYAIDIVRYKLVVLMAKRLEKLTECIENFFEKLEKVTNTLDIALEKNIRKNEATVQKIVYVCATGEEKEYIYKSMRLNTLESDSNINSMVVRSLYGKFCAEEKPDADNNKEYVDTSIENSFYREALKTYSKIIKKEHRKDIDMDIYSAVCLSSDIAYEKEQTELKESGDLDELDILDINVDTGEETGADERHDRHIDAMYDLVATLRRLGAPFLISEDDLPVSETETETPEEFEDIYNMKIKKRKVLWGFNPIVCDKCPELARILRVNTDLQEDSAYSKNELDCYVAVYGIQAGYVEKFNELKGGDYYTNYNNAVNLMIRGVANGDESVLVNTPHLDKTWHLHLPYITPEKQLQETEKFYRAFWLAFAYGMITLDNKEKFRITRYKKDDTGYEYQTTENVFYNGVALGKVDVLELISALRLDGSFIVDAKRFEQRFKEECEAIETYEGTEFLRGRTVKETVKTTESGETAKNTFGGLGTKAETNAVTLIVRYHNSKKHDNNVTSALIRTLETLCQELVKNKYELDATDKVDLKKYEICQRIFKNSGMKNKDIELLNHWKDAWSRL